MTLLWLSHSIAHRSEEQGTAPDRFSAALQSGRYAWTSWLMTMSEEEKYKPPEPDKADVAHAVTRLGLGVNN